MAKVLEPISYTELIVDNGKVQQHSILLKQVLMVLNIMLVRNVY